MVIFENIQPLEVKSKLFYKGCLVLKNEFFPENFASNFSPFLNSPDKQFYCVSNCKLNCNPQSVCKVLTIQSCAVK